MKCEECFYAPMRDYPHRHRWRQRNLKRLRRRQKRLYWARKYMEGVNPRWVGGSPSLEWRRANLEWAEAWLAKELARPYWVNERVPEFVP